MSFPNLFTWWCVLFYFQYLFESLKTYKHICLYISIVFSNTLIYRYIAIVYVYKYVWKQKKQINGKPVRKRIAFVTLPFFWISIYHCALSFFLFQDILFARLIASLSGWFLFFWSQTFLFLCILVNMIFCFSMFYYPYCCLILLYCWLCEKFLECLKICILWSCLLLNMKNWKHVNLKYIKSEYELSYYYLFYSISFVYMYVCKLKNKNVCNSIVLSWFSLLTVTWV